MGGNKGGFIDGVIDCGIDFGIDSGGSIDCCNCCYFVDNVKELLTVTKTSSLKLLDDKLLFYLNTS